MWRPVVAGSGGEGGDGGVCIAAPSMRDGGGVTCRAATGSLRSATRHSRSGRKERRSLTLALEVLSIAVCSFSVLSRHSRKV
uniref:Predicted protein n=1 Tax=Hordeum vulgare subsp. vulgare TaxID=112509 RepID=F2EBX2_HORVV|nr:predicted protein [Hordeum vulgare subsp. vulgare]